MVAAHVTPARLQAMVRPGGRRQAAPNRASMRNRQLHAALHAFAEEAGWQLASATAEGAEVPFEVVETGRRDAPLYCYRPLTADFIAQRVGLLGRLPSYLPALHALQACGRLDAYLQARGGDVHGWEAPPGRERAEAALR